MCLIIFVRMQQYLKYLFVLCFICWIQFGVTQTKSILQFSGLISSVGSELPVAYVTIKNTSYNNQTFISNNDGYFSFVAHSGDTIQFSSVGYDPVTFVIPVVSDDKFTAHIQMRSLVIELPAVTPFPWASYEDYLADFMGMKDGHDPVASARNNLSPEAMAALARIVPRSADEIQSFNSTQRHINMTNKNINQRYANPLLNPFGWAQLINQIQRGDYSRQKLKY